ncbi:MAG: NAD(P)/FAD-dependent oxidoreductase [Flexibacteraceae bacterium]
MNLQANIPTTALPRVVIIGGGFAGLELAKKLDNQQFQIVLLDKNNYHQFQPLFYQVATAGLEPSSISFPLRKLFQKNKNTHIRVTEVQEVDTQNKEVITPVGTIAYDYLVVAVGADTNFFGMPNIEKYAYPMKNVGEALLLRNTLLQNYEDALVATDPELRKALMNVVIVGGGATGVELSGAIVEMKKFVLPKDLPELDFAQMEVTLLEAGPKLLNGMSEKAQTDSLKFLQDMGVKVKLNAQVKDYDGNQVILADGTTLPTKTLIWAAGVTGNKVKGIPAEAITRGNRIVVNRLNEVTGLKDVYAIGDIAYMEEEKFPKGHPQVAQVAMQMGTNVAKNLKAGLHQQPKKPFVYTDLGSMATVGKNKAVVDLPFIKFSGFIAWLTWMFIHLLSIIGAKNKVITFINWVVSYFSYDQSLRLIMRSKTEKQ